MDAVEDLCDAARRPRECVVIGHAITLARAWLAECEPMQAAREILAAAEGMSPLGRSVAVGLAETLGDDTFTASIARSAWRSGATRPWSTGRKLSPRTRSRSA